MTYLECDLPFPGNTAVAKLLLEHNADVHIKDKFGLTPLIIAAAKDNLEMIQELELRGAKFNASYHGIACLFFACFFLCCFYIEHVHSYVVYYQIGIRRRRMIYSHWCYNVSQDVNNDGLSAAEVAHENENDNVINYIGGRDHYRVIDVSRIYLSTRTCSRAVSTNIYVPSRSTLL